MFKLEDLPYDYDALEPRIDAETMKIHHTKHHAGYVDKLNKALEGAPVSEHEGLEELLRSLASIPESVRMAVRNNGGGHANHSLFWKIMSPHGGGTPSGPLFEALARDFGSFEAFHERFVDAALSRFGSGWAWLVLSEGKLAVTSTANQDSPLMLGQTPVLGIDVWEHAYYLRYHNRRADYVQAWWKLIDWDEVSKRYEIARAAPLGAALLEGAGSVAVASPS